MLYRISVVFHQSCKRFSTSECVIRNRNRTQSFFFNNIFKCVHLSLYEVLSVRRSIHLSVRPYGILGRVHTTLLRHYVGPSVITSRFWRSELKGEQIWVTDPAQMPFFPCPPAHDWCCRVYSLVPLLRLLPCLPPWNKRQAGQGNCWPFDAVRQHVVYLTVSLSVR